MDRCKKCNKAVPTHVMRQGLCYECSELKRKQDEKEAYQ